MVDLSLDFLIESLEPTHASKYKNSSKEATAQPTPPQIDLFTKQATAIMKHDKQTKTKQNLNQNFKKTSNQFVYSKGNEAYQNQRYKCPHYKPSIFIK